MVLRNSLRAMPLFGAPHRPIAFGSHKSLRKSIHCYVLTGLLLFCYLKKPNNLKFTQLAKVLIHSWLANKAKARLPIFSCNLALAFRAKALSVSAFCRLFSFRLFHF